MPLLPEIDVVAPARGCTISRVDRPLPMNFDVLRVSFGPEATVTEHPVEQGFEVSDHIQVQAVRFTVDAWVTDSPLVSTAPRVQQAISFLNGCMGQLLTVTIGGEGTFQNMVLEGFTHDRTSVEGRGFMLRFKQIRIASAMTVKIPPSQPAAIAAAGAPTEVDSGQQATTTGTPVSALYDFRDLTQGLSPVALIRKLVKW